MAKKRYETRRSPFFGKHHTRDSIEKRTETWFQNNPRPYRDKKRLFNEHIINNKSVTQIAKEWHTHHQVIKQWLKIHNIPYIRRSDSRQYWNAHSKEPLRKHMRGIKNPRWNNGIAEYKNHVLLKKNRIKTLARFDGNCPLCGELAKMVHHLDFSKDNHNELFPICYRCHWLFHSKKEKTVRKIMQRIPQF